MHISLKQLSDCGDRFEGTWSIDSIAVTVSIDKHNIGADTEAKLQQIHERLRETLDASRDYFDANKSQYSMAYIDDLYDPQVILGTDTYSVYWSSDKGEPHGACVIGVDFHSDTHEPFDLTIGD